MTKLYQITLVTFVLFAAVCLFQYLRMANNAPLNGIRVLVLGGNGFLGSATVSVLLERGANVTTLNRGFEYHDAEDVIRPSQISKIQCDRDDVGSCEEQLLKSVKLHGQFDITIDFSGLRPTFVSNTLEELLATQALNPTGLYIYISSDSVYEVVDTTFNTASGLVESLVTEETVMSPEGIASPDQYARDKLLSESILRAARKSQTDSFPPVVFLRLPDVIGPGDTSSRFFNYLIWIKIHKQFNFPLRVFRVGNDQKSSEDTRRMSMVYNYDVGTFIADWLLKQYVNQPKQTLQLVGDQAINLAFNQDPFTLRQFLDVIGNHTYQGTEPHEEDTGIEYELTPKQVAKTLAFYPSVTKGPISTQKLKSLLLRNNSSDWSSTSLEKAVAETCMYFERILKRILENPKTSLDAYLLHKFATIVGIPFDKLVEILQSVQVKEEQLIKQGLREL